MLDKEAIEALRKLESEEQSLSASRSAFESVAATSKIADAFDGEVPNVLGTYSASA